jgi:hypothetical protein
MNISCKQGDHRLSTTDTTCEFDRLRFFRELRDAAIVPFAERDSSVGMEYEVQVAVAGQPQDVDLPITIAQSTFFKNVAKRSARGDLPPETLKRIEVFLQHNPGKVWENSWVRFPEERLCPQARRLLSQDLRADKSNPHSKPRGDLHRFRIDHRGAECLRLPISYLLKLALADAIGSDPLLPQTLQATGQQLLDHLLSDNTSPEILSFSIPVAGERRIGDLAAAESGRTQLLCQLLIQYANKHFGLEESGQKCLLYAAPHAPSRQKLLNSLVPDSYYRHLFISPCLSGWKQGEEKFRYMELCHRTLSRSQLNTIGKLKDAGIITRNLIVLPNTSTTCLANNGIHVSLGSRCLTAMAGDASSSFNATVEKYVGDLVIKIVEHFLPLLVTTYSAAPYRLDFADFHPESVLGFLPHELDYTHLRMIWRRWKKKAGLSVLGRAITPFGPRRLDELLAKVMRLKGDLVPDFRLIDYLVTLLSTETSPGLNGALGNHQHLKEELGELGVFDPRMAMYLPYRQRLCATSGYAGFEGRSYSLFHSLREDLAEAVDLQNLVTALAFRYVVEGKVHHHDIPDQPFIESERRQIFFGRAIGIPTFFVRADSTNRFLRKILTDVVPQRHSKRYKGYLRIGHDDYSLALLRLLEKDGADLIERHRLAPRLASLKARLRGEKPTALDKLLAGIGEELPKNGRPLAASAEEFNGAMERYYRTTLKTEQLSEALALVGEDCQRLESEGSPLLTEVVATLDGGISAAQYLHLHRHELLTETAGSELLRNLLRISLAVIHHHRNSL